MMGAVRVWLRDHPVPPTGTDELDHWKAECRALGPDAPTELLVALEAGNEEEQYGALMGLRQFGYEVEGDGYDADLRYTIKRPGSSETEVVLPRRSAGGDS